MRATSQSCRPDYKQSAPAARRVASDAREAAGGSTDGGGCACSITGRKIVHDNAICMQCAPLTACKTIQCLAPMAVRPAPPIQLLPHPLTARSLKWPFLPKTLSSRPSSVTTLHVLPSSPSSAACVRACHMPRGLVDDSFSLLPALHWPCLQASPLGSMGAVADTHTYCTFSYAQLDCNF